MSVTDILGIQELTVSNLQPDIEHNHALHELDERIRAISLNTTAEPASPDEGDVYILASIHTGTDWAGFAENDLAHFWNGRWENHSPTEGERMWVNDKDDVYVFNGTTWDTVGVTTAPIRVKEGNDYAGSVNPSAMKVFPWTVAPVLLGPPVTKSTQGFSSCRYSPNGEYIAMVRTSNPRLYVYQRAGLNFRLLPFPATGPTGTGQAVCWSPDSQFVAVAHSVTPFITIYQRDGNTLTKLTNPASLPPNTPYEIDWSPNGQFLCITHLSGAHVTIYEVEGTTFTKLPNLVGLYNATMTACAFSPDGEMLAIGGGAGNRLFIFRIRGNTFTWIGATPISNLVNYLRWSPDSHFLAVGTNSGSWYHIFVRDGESFTESTTMDTAPTGQVLAISWHPNGNIMAFGHSNSPYLSIYKVTGTSFVKIDNPTLLNTTASTLDFDPTGELLSCAGYFTDFFKSYQTPTDMSATSTVGVINTTRGVE